MKAKIWNHKSWIKETNPKRLKEFFKGLLTESGFGLISFQEHYYEPFGYSAVWLISESHLAIHTFPEEEKTYIELSSCTKEYYLNFIKRIKKL